MNFLKTFESRVSNIFGAVEAPFSFRKLAREAAREMENQTLVINGANTAPALYTILISSADDPLMAPYYNQLSDEIADFVKAQAEKKHYVFVGEPLVRFMIDPALKSGKFSVFAENVDAPTLGRLYEEERAYQNSLLERQGVHVEQQEEPQPVSRATPLQPASASSSQGSYQQSYYDEPDEPDQDPLDFVSTDGSVPQHHGPSADSIPSTSSAPRSQRSGLGGAAATGAAAGISSNMAQARSNPTPSQPLAQLVDVVTGDTYDVVSARCVIGRERSISDIVLRDPNVSRRHAELIFTGSDWTLEDLNSTNGTLVNNRRITRCPLRNGDLLTFGLSTFEFRS